MAYNGRALKYSRSYMGEVPEVLNEFSPIYQVLYSRGIPFDDIEHYLNTTDDDILDPQRIKNMLRGVTMLIQHIAANDDIMVQVDSDCDGFTSAAVIINYLYDLFPGFTSNHIFYRLHDGKEHGLIVDTIPDNIKLVIAPDSSSNDYEQHRQLKERGCDVLVIDHHEAEKYSEDAIVINNQLDTYPTKSLSGVGMVYKFCSYFDLVAGTHYADKYLDLTALGIIGDMMDLRDFETKHIILRGLNSIQNTFLKEIVQVQNYSISKGGGLCPFTVSFYIVPLINATIRSGTADEKKLLFETMIEFLAEEMIPSTKRGEKGQLERKVTQACRNCVNIKSRQTKQQDAELVTIENIIQDKDLVQNKIIAVKLEGSAVNKNLTGLIANKIMAEYQHPVLLLKKVEEDGKIYWEGSGRNVETPELPSLKDFLNDSGCTEYAVGHASAFGVKIPDEKFNRLIEYSNQQLADCSFEPSYKVDFIWDRNDMRPSDILNIAKYKLLWGKGLEEPKVMIKNITLTKDNVTLMSPDKNPTLKIILPNGTKFIKFKSSQEEFESLTQMPTTINIIGTCSENEWNGTITPQILIDDYEIERQMKYYF